MSTVICSPDAASSNSFSLHGATHAGLRHTRPDLRVFPPVQHHADARFLQVGGEVLLDPTLVYLLFVGSAPGVADETLRYFDSLLLHIGLYAVMTDLMRLEPADKVLEIGTGSGYQAAILAELVREVYTLEIIEPLAKQAQERLPTLGYKHVGIRVGDGYYGWEEHAPFDAILVTAAASHIPPPLVRQLKPGGRMVIPVGTHFLTQYLMLVNKAQDGSVSTQQILPVRFVPLTGGH
jgi:protein-L-isoaspartate(D-aspartate) O-methyltransferase